MLLSSTLDASRKTVKSIRIFNRSYATSLQATCPYNDVLFPNTADMLQHNLMVIYRSFKRFKSTFIINLVGLAMGLASALLIYLWVNDELHIDSSMKRIAGSTRLWRP